MVTTTNQKDLLEKVVDKLEPIYVKNFTKFYLLYPFAVTGWIISASQVTNVAAVGYFILSAVVIYYAIYTLNLVLAYRFRLKDIKNLNNQIAELNKNNITVCENRNRIGDRFARLMRSNADYYSHDEWDEKIRIEESGNTLIERDIVFIPGANGIDNVFLNLYGNELPADETDVSFKAVLIKESGDRIALEFLQVWDEGRHLAFVILDRTYQADEKVRVLSTWYWPKYSANLMEGKSEDHKIKLSRACKKFSCTLEIKKVDWYATHRIIGEPLAPREVTYSCNVRYLETTDSHQFTFEAHDQEVDSSFGIRIHASE